MKYQWTPSPIVSIMRIIKCRLLLDLRVYHKVDSFYFFADNFESPRSIVLTNIVTERQRVCL